MPAALANFFRPPRAGAATYICAMDYFRDLTRLLRTEQDEDRRSYQQLAESTTVAQRREAGLAWFPVAIRDTELGRGDYLTV